MRSTAGFAGAFFGGGILTGTVGGTAHLGAMKGRCVGVGRDGTDD